jgi:hypothetical protein
MESNDCTRCQLLTAAIDELSSSLARSQSTRRGLSQRIRELERLLLIDMEEEHDRAGADFFGLGSSLCQADGFGEEA